MPHPTLVPVTGVVKGVRTGADKELGPTGDAVVGGGAGMVAAPVAPAIGLLRLARLFSYCSLFLDSFPMPAREPAITPPVFGPEVGNS